MSSLLSQFGVFRIRLCKLKAELNRRNIGVKISGHEDAQRLARFVGFEDDRGRACLNICIGISHGRKNGNWVLAPPLSRTCPVRRMRVANKLRAMVVESMAASQFMKTVVILKTQRDRQSVRDMLQACECFSVLVTTIEAAPGLLTVGTVGGTVGPQGTVRTVRTTTKVTVICDSASVTNVRYFGRGNEVEVCVVEAE